MTETAPTTPAGVYATFYPASVVLPSGEVWHRCKVLLTPEGVQVYRSAPIQPDTENAPAFAAPVNYAAAGRPMNDARMGYYLPLTDGVLAITGGGGCGCGSKLKYWVPEWARNVLPWPA